MDWSKIKYFDKAEFECPCCGECNVNEVFVARINRAREFCGIPFRITSGYRCEKHNTEVGAVPGSSHCKGLAVDIRCASGTARFEMINAMLLSGFTRIGIGDSFIHVDDDPDKLRSVMWTYYE